jgi:peroxiredoxin
MKFNVPQRLLIALLSAVLPAAAWSAGQPKIDPEAEAVLQKLSDFYSKAGAFQVKAGFRMTVESTGVRRELWSAYDVSVERPNKAALVVTDGVGLTVVSDGKKLHVYIPTAKKFTTENAPDTLEELFKKEEVTLISSTMGNLLFIDQLVKQKPREAILTGISRVRYAGLEKLDETPVHHLRLLDDDSSWDLWVQDGDQPLVRKVSPDLSRALADAAENMPQMKDASIKLAVRFDDWVVDDHLDEKAFAFQPPLDAKQVAGFFDKDEQPAKGLIGKAAPQADLDLLEGGKLDLGDNKGKHIVVLDFWASWCAPCAQSLPAISELLGKYKDRGVVHYGINQKEDADKINDFLKNKKLSLKVALDKDGKLAEAYDVKGIPFLVIIGKDGLVKFVHAGLQPDLKDRVALELDALLANEEIPTSAETPAH